MIDGSKELDSKDQAINKLLLGKDCLVVTNKSDLGRKVTIAGISVSAKKRKIDKLIEVISHKLKFVNFINSKQVILQSTRAIGLMEQALGNLNVVKKLIVRKEPIDLTSEFLLKAHQCVLNILGKEENFDFINEIFRKFCVGK
ncbi:hypothetical protein FACS1894166_01860 [Bacilli bacterium]|nr:hypothetical protein FACS1894166_01860 [Bacilli bacterium]